MRELLNDLARRYDALDRGDSQASDWSAFVEQAQAVYERALILRYKSLERLQAESREAEPEGQSEEAPAVVWSLSAAEPEAVVQAPAVEAAPTKAIPVEDPELEFEPTAIPEASVEPAAPTHSPTPVQSAPGEGVSLAEKLSLQPLTAILPSLGINDRVRFAGVLFSGDMSRLMAACQTAENADNFDAARAAVVGMATEGLDWKDEEEAPYQFMQLVQRVHL